MSSQPTLPSNQQPQGITFPAQHFPDEVHQLRRKILDSVIKETAILIDLQSSTNRSFIARTCPHAALCLEEALLYQLTRK